MIKSLPFILIVLLAACAWQAACEESDLSYGLYLFNGGKYELSILELERYIYSYPQDFYTPHAQLLLALSYANESKYESALSLLGSLERAVSNSPWEDRYSGLLCEAGFHRLSLLFRQKKKNEFDLDKERISTVCIELNEKLYQYIDSMTVALEIYEMDWRAALEEVERSRNLSPTLSGWLKDELEETIEHNEKSPMLGGFLSIVPGLGHLYAGRAWDGFKSLLINATFITLSVVCFTNDLPVAGGIFAGVEGVLYIANIYGGVNAVLQENARYAVGKRDSMLKLLPAPPLKIISVTEEFDF